MKRKLISISDPILRHVSATYEVSIGIFTDQLASFDYIHPTIPTWSGSYRLSGFTST